MAWSTTRDIRQNISSVSHWPATRYLTATNSSILSVRTRFMWKRTMAADVARTMPQMIHWSYLLKNTMEIPVIATAMEENRRFLLNSFWSIIS